MTCLVPILLAEDNDDDVSLMRRAFERARILNPLVVVSDGEQAIAYLKGEGIYKNRAEYPLPNLLLLDIRMPKKDGFEVLRWVRGEPGLRALRVVVLTSSTDVRDANAAFDLGADAFIIKPADFLRLVEFSEALGGSWLWADEETTLLREGAKVRAALKTSVHN
jgi:CheY-like chemotaxis protein